MMRTTQGCTSQARGILPRAWAHVKKFQLWSFALLFLSACVPSGEKEQSLSSSSPTGNHPPVVRAASILPNPIVLSGPISVLVQAQDEDRDAVSFRYRWFANGGFVVERPDNTLDPKFLKRGDQVVVEVVPSDGKSAGAPFKTPAIVVGNTPPIVSHITIEPDEQSFTRRVLAKADISDPDGDSMTVTYRWLQNEAMVKEGEDSQLDIVGFSMKDSIQVEVTASDGIVAAKPVASQVFVMNNTTPKITSSPTSAAQGDHYEYQVVATDPDDDPLTYVLEVAPPGMTIDPQSGMIRWTVASGAAGSHRVRVVAKDSKGGFATQEFDLTTTATPAPPPQGA